MISSFGLMRRLAAGATVIIAARGPAPAIAAPARAAAPGRRGVEH